MRIIWKLFSLNTTSDISWKNNILEVKDHIDFIITNLIEYEWEAYTTIPKDLDDSLSEENILNQYLESDFNLKEKVYQRQLIIYPLVDDYKKYKNKKKCVAIVLIFLLGKHSKKPILNNYRIITPINKKQEIKEKKIYKINLLKCIHNINTFKFNNSRTIGLDIDKKGINFDLDDIIDKTRSQFKKIKLNIKDLEEEKFNFRIIKNKDDYKKDK